MRLNTDSAGGQAILTDNGTVFCNGQLVMREGDRLASHETLEHPATLPRMVTSCPTVFVENQPVCGLGDEASCGHTATPGSSNVNLPNILP